MDDFLSNSQPRRTGPGDTSKFQSRRSVTRARASKEKIAREKLIQRNQQRQARTERTLKRFGLLAGTVASVLIILYVFWWGPRMSDQKLRDGLDVELPAEQRQ
jgi:type II secretory pathway component PulM